MDAELLITLTLGCIIAWLIAIADRSTPAVYRILGVIPGVPILVWYLFYLIGATHSPTWNNLEGGPAALAAMSLGMIAFLSRDKKPKEPPPAAGLTA